MLDWSEHEPEIYVKTKHLDTTDNSFKKYTFKRKGSLFVRLYCCLSSSSSSLRSFGLWLSLFFSLCFFLLLVPHLGLSTAFLLVLFASLFFFKKIQGIIAVNRFLWEKIVFTLTASNGQSMISANHSAEAEAQRYTISRYLCALHQHKIRWHRDKGMKQKHTSLGQPLQNSSVWTPTQDREGTGCKSKQLEMVRRRVIIKMKDMNPFLPHRVHWRERKPTE